MIRRVNVVDQLAFHAQLSALSMPSPSSFTPLTSWLAVLGWSDRFELLESIGSGGMGQVWRARERDTGRIFALKTLDPSKFGDEHLLARLDIEAATLIKLRDAGQHQHIVPIIDFKVSDTHACLVMEFIPGLNLRKWCDTHQLSLTKRVELIALVARATGWFHSLDVIHRDLKPANILVSAVTHQPVIVDFSIAKLDDTLPLTLTNEALGTAPYMAPEQFDHALAPISPATDVYALGVTLYELLTHILPHPGELTQIIQRHHDEVRPARPSLINKEVPHDLESICLKALSHRPGDRYANGEVFAADLDRYLAGEPVTARPMSTAAYVVRQAIRRPSLTIAVTVCVVLLLGLVTLINRAAYLRHWHELESQVTQAMQQKTWSREALQGVDAALSELAIHDAEHSSRLRHAVVEDVSNDISLALQQASLGPETVTWINSTLAALKLRAPEESERLSKLVEERQSRWETLVDLRAPFANREGLFPKGRQIIKGDLLFPDYAPELKTPAVAVKQGVPVPFEFSTTLVATEPFQHVVFRVAGLQMGFYRVGRAQDAVFDQVPGLTRKSPGGLIYLLRPDSLPVVVHVPDETVFDQPIEFYLRMERNRVEASVNQRWRVAVDDIFSLTVPDPQKNILSISWARSLGMKDLVIRARSAASASPLDAADLYATQGQWAKAQAAYESLIGHPVSGLEAAFKLGIVLDKQGKSAGAMQTWERIANGTAGLWRDLSRAHLWIAALQTQGVKGAKVHLDQLPGVGAINPEFTRAIPGAARRIVEAAYAPTGWGMNFLRTRVEDVDDAVKANALIGTPLIKTAAWLGNAYHLAGLDPAAVELFHKALLAVPAKEIMPEHRLNAISALDQWGRAVASEHEPKFKSRLKDWLKAYTSDGSFIALNAIERSRVHARAGHWQEALEEVRAVFGIEGPIEPRLITNARLIEGLILKSLHRPDEARAAWRAGIHSGGAATLKNPLQLSDLIFLHSANEDWTPEACVDVLARLIGKTKVGMASSPMQSMFVRVFASDPAYVRALNNFNRLDDAEEIALDYAFTRRPFRDVGRQWFARMLETFILETGFPTNISTIDRQRVRRTVEQCLHIFATASNADPGEFGKSLLAWSSPLLRSQFDLQKLGLSDGLRADLEWMLEQRYAWLKAQ